MPHIFHAVIPYVVTIGGPRLHALRIASQMIISTLSTPPRSMTSWVANAPQRSGSAARVSMNSLPQAGFMKPQSLPTAKRFAFFTRLTPTIQLSVNSKNEDAPEYRRCSRAGRQGVRRAAGQESDPADRGGIAHAHQCASGDRARRAHAQAAGFALQGRIAARHQSGQQCIDGGCGGSRVTRK